VATGNTGIPEAKDRPGNIRSDEPDIGEDSTNLLLCKIIMHLVVKVDLIPD
jgi:hypothetical protein